MFEINFTDKAKQQLSKLPSDIQIRVTQALDRTRIRPEHFFTRLVALKLYKLRVGDYRILAEINNGLLTILVIKVGHRRDVYK